MKPIEPRINGVIKGNGETTILPSRLGLFGMRQVIGIVSIGDMGLGMAKLLKAHDYRVVTVAEGRRYPQGKYLQRHGLTGK